MSRQGIRGVCVVSAPIARQDDPVTKSHVSSRRVRAEKAVCSDYFIQALGNAIVGALAHVPQR